MTVGFFSIAYDFLVVRLGFAPSKCIHRFQQIVFVLCCCFFCWLVCQSFRFFSVLHSKRSNDVRRWIRAPKFKSNCVFDAKQKQHNTNHPFRNQIDFNFGFLIKSQQIFAFFVVHFSCFFFSYLSCSKWAFPQMISDK